LIFGVFWGLLGLSGALVIGGRVLDTGVRRDREYPIGSCGCCRCCDLPWWVWVN
jgi:hypothetical protein